MTEIDVEVLARKVRDLAEAYPDAVYPSEQSEPEGGYGASYAAGEVGPGVGCIVGQAMKALGVSNEDVSEMDNIGFFSHVPNNVISPVKIRVITHRQEILAEWIDQVQQNQDAHNSWGEAALFADQEMK